MIIPESDQFQIFPAYCITPHSIRIWLFTAYSNEICLYYYSLPHASTGWESVLLKLGVKMVIINIWFLRLSHNQNTSDTLWTKATVCFREGSTLERVHVTYSWTSKLNSGLSYSKWSHDELVASLVAILSEPDTARTNFVNQKVHSPNLLKRRYISEVARICIIIIFHMSKLWKVKFSLLCDVIFQVGLQEKFDSERVKKIGSSWLKCNC